MRLILDDGDGPHLDIEGAKSRTFLADVIGAACTTTTSTNGTPAASTNETHVLEVYAYPRRTEGHCLHRPDPAALERRAQHLHFTMPSAALAQQWAARLKALCRGGVPVDEKEERKFLCLVNPVSGRRQSKSIFYDVALPMLKQAGVQWDLTITTSMGHAKAVVLELDLEAYDGIIAIGGDGILSEILHGLYERDPVGMSALKRIPCAIVKGGTGNGLCASVLYHNQEGFSPLSAIFLALKAKAWIPGDLALLETADSQQHLSFLMFAWGLIADVDIDSEVIRCVGEARLHLFSLFAVLRSRRYRGRLTFLPCSAHAEATVQLPPLGSPLPVTDGWVSIEDDFLLVLISCVSHIGEDVHSNPGKALGDGKLNIMVLRKKNITRWRLLSLFLALEHGGHVEGEEVEIYEARAWRLEPLGPAGVGVFSMDGEVIPYGPVQGKVLPQAFHLMGSMV